MEPKVIDALTRSLDKLKDEAKHDPSRELGIAITQLETAILWYKHDINLKDAARK